MSNVIQFSGVTTKPLSIEQVCTEAIKWADPERPLIIIATDKITGKLSIATTTAEIEFTLAQITRAEHMAAAMCAESEVEQGTT